mmetsp:Transcript_16558/g.32998  ORF Transcript_16558/g.32998 Transcript_16558/m.32998 type:complete len:201 (-) Transcript_16558:29-631(-)
MSMIQISNVMLVFALLLLFAQIMCSTAQRISPRLEQQSIDRLMHGLNEMEKSTIYSMNAQGLPVKEISTAINMKKSEAEIVKIIDVLESSHTDYLGRMSREGHVQKAPPRTKDKDGLQRPQRPRKGAGSDKGGNSTNSRRKNVGEGKKAKAKMMAEQSKFSHKRERVAKQKERDREAEKARPRANKVGVHGGSGRKAISQ